MRREKCMINEEFLKSKYSEDEAIRILKMKSYLKSKFGDSLGLLKQSDEIASLAVGLKLDENCVCAALVYPYLINKKLSSDNFEDESELKELIKKIEQCEALSSDYTDADGLKEMLIAITKDIRIIMLKIAEMLVYARANVARTQDKSAIKMFKAIDDIFAPIAARLGLSEMKSELQDLSFRFHDPEGCKELEEEVAKETRANNEMISEIIDEIKGYLKNSGIEAVCYGRIKHISSINNKIKNRHVALKNIYDISAVRILVKSVSECYTALGIVHSSFVPVDGRFKDYIAHPKPNGYKSLHTTVYYKDEFFEVQIRTFDMHEFAEYGIAAHFLYKEQRSKLKSIDNKLLWIRKLLENKDEVSSERLIEELKTDVYLGEIFVCTPKGKVIKLPENSTPLDFAYMIHTDIGNSCVGAKVNGVMVPLSTGLQNSDVVEIMTSSISKGPSRDWLKIVKTPQARDKINAYFKKQMKEENIKLGKSMIEAYAKSNNLQLSSIFEEKYVDEMLKKNAFLSMDEIYASVGYGSLSAEKVISKLQNIKLKYESQNKNIFTDVSKNPLTIQSKSEILGTGGMLTKYCKCCNPIPGDEIMGYVSRGRGIIIHTKDCPSAQGLPKSRFIKVDWNLGKDKDLSFMTVIELIAKSTNTVYIEITNALSELKIHVTSLNTSTNKNNELVLKIGIMVKNKSELERVKSKLVSLASVYEVL